MLYFLKTVDVNNLCIFRLILSSFAEGGNRLTTLSFYSSTHSSQSPNIFISPRFESSKLNKIKDRTHSLTQT
jgi:hypothetical protein